jgi:hypothetical protein
MAKYLFPTVLVVMASLAVYGAPVAPAAVASDGYDHSAEMSRSAADAEARY